MQFVSLFFLIFIAAVVVCYFLVPKKAQWVVLLVASYTYFWINSGLLLLVLFASTLVTWLIGRAITRANEAGKAWLAAHPDIEKSEKKQFQAAQKKRQKRIMLVGVLFDLGVLLFLKYFNFFAGSVTPLLAHFGITIPHLHLLLPLGISFYTLQAMAYLIDLNRNKYAADQNLLHFMLFMSYFPQIVQGPICRYNQLAEQLYASHDFDYDRFCRGCQLILWGFMKKLILADRIAGPVNQIFDHYGQYHGLLVFLAAAGYGLQVYADFSGGMDIARGISEILGIKLELNFNQPYFSRSVEDFWRRWHITLGAWMRDYIFYPLSLSKTFAKVGKQARKWFGGSIGKKIPPFIAMFIVYFLVGVWHGAEWKYAFYGAYNGIFIMFGILLADVYASMRKTCRVREESLTWAIIQIVRTFVIISWGRFFSRGLGVTASLKMMRGVFTNIQDLSFLTDGTLFTLGLNNANWILLVVMIIVVFLVDLAHERGIEIRKTISQQALPVRWGIYLTALFAVVIFGVYGPGYDAASFIYQQF